MRRDPTILGWLRRATPTLVALAMAGALTPAASAGAATGWTITQITENATDDYAQGVSDDRVRLSVGGQPFTWTQSDGLLPAEVTSEDGVHVSGDRRVWQSSGGSDGGTDNEIFTSTPSDGVVQLTENQTDDAYLLVSGDNVLWLGVLASPPPYGPKYEVMLWTPTDGVTHLAPTLDWTWPVVVGERVAWGAAGGSDGGSDSEVFTWTASSGLVQLSKNETQDREPVISGDRIAWYNHGDPLIGRAGSIFTWTPTQATTRIISGLNGVFACPPRISGDRVVVVSDGGTEGGNDGEIFTWSPSGGALQVTENTWEDGDFAIYCSQGEVRASGDRIVWGGDGSGYPPSPYDVFTWTPSSGVVRLTETPTWERNLCVSGDMAAWSSQGGTDGGGDWEVFVAVANRPPTLTFSHDTITVNEGQEAENAATASDPDGDVLTPSASIGTLEITPGCFWKCRLDDGPYSGRVTGTVKDSTGASASDAFTLIVNNVNPTVDSVTVPSGAVPMGTSVSVSAAFSDPGRNDTHTGEWSWDDGTTGVGTITETDGSGTMKGQHTFATPGIYSVTAKVTDKDGGIGTMTATDYIVVYDPTAGFVTGGGWITSPLGAYGQDATLSGKATFGFVSKYLKGRSTPSGETQFQFHSAGMYFTSSSYDWLIVSGSRATFKGVGTINGSGNYGFMLSAFDGQLGQGTSQDKFRVKIWNTATDEVVYDNQSGASDGADPSTVIGGGSIVVHKP